MTASPLLDIIMKRVIVQAEFLSADQASYEAEARDALLTGERIVVFDLGRVKYIDSIAVSMIDRLSVDADKRDAIIILDNLSHVAKDFFDSLELNHRFFTRLPEKRISAFPVGQ